MVPQIRRCRARSNALTPLAEVNRPVRLVAAVYDRRIKFLAELYSEAARSWVLNSATVIDRRGYRGGTPADTRKNAYGPLLIPQRHHRIDLRGAQRGNIAGQRGHADQHE